MTHYERLGVQPDASLQDIHAAYQRLLLGTDAQDTESLAAIKVAYNTLSDSRERQIYDADLAREKLRQERLLERPFPVRRKYRLLYEPEAVNHYQFINLLFAIDRANEDYLIPGQSLNKRDRNRLYWQLHTVSTKLYAESEGLKRVRKKDKSQQDRLDLLLCNEEKIATCISVLAGAHEQCLYDLSLGPKIVSHTEEMQSIAQLIGGWEQMVAYVQANSRLNSADALFALHEAGCLNPANFNLLMASVESDKRQLCHIASVINQLADENLLNQPNFARVMANSQFALSITRGLSALASRELLNQQAFEVLLEAGQYANTVGFGWDILKELNLLNPCNREMIIQCAENNIGILLLKSFRHLEKQQLFTPEDGLDFLWTGDTEELQALSLRIDELFAYGISFLHEDKDKAQAVFLLAIELKKFLKNHFSKPIEEQRETEQQFKKEFKQHLHSLDTVMANYLTYWQVIVANIVIALTGVGLLALGVYYFKTGQCFFAQNQHEQLRDTIEKSAWLQERRVLV